MIVMVDGKKINVKNDVCIIYENVDPDNEMVDLHVIANCEGVITDLIENDEDGDSEVIGSNAIFIEDLVENAW